MRNTFIILLFFTGSLLYGQSDSIERASLYDKLIKKEIKQEDFSRIWSAWLQKMKDIKSYPDIPVDRSGQVHYSYIHEFKDVDKSRLFYHTLEWLSLTYSIFPSNIYSNIDDGRIVFRNSVNLATGNTCIYTGVISVKNEKMLIDFINIGYQTLVEAHNDGEIWIPDRTFDFGINQFLPIILRRSNEWDADLNLLKTTNDFFNKDTNNLFRFLLQYDLIYGY